MKTYIAENGDPTNGSPTLSIDNNIMI